MSHKGILVVISGFAGTGKGTVIERLRKQYDNYELSVSATTRSPRPGEQEGVHYFYKTKEEFLHMIDQDELLEHKEYVGNYYGTPRAFVQSRLEEGKNVILEIEPQGAMDIKKKMPDTVMIFLAPPDAVTLRDRLAGRATEDAQKQKERLHRAAEESDMITSYDYIVVNDDLDQTVEEVHQVISAAHFRMGSNLEFVKKLQEEMQMFV
ncbi:MAG: guanylate kinase [Eubacteriales bacterium]|nr:guanylate kinase [Eubacteriales bacterium]